MLICNRSGIAFAPAASPANEGLHCRVYLPCGNSRLSSGLRSRQRVLDLLTVFPKMVIEWKTQAIKTLLLYWAITTL